MTTLIQFIKEAHQGQKYGDLDYFYHLDKTAKVAERFSSVYAFLADPSVVIACYGHDLLEDTPVTLDDLVAAGFSSRTIRIIQKVTDEPGKNRKERKLATYPKIYGDLEATAVKLCDRIANVEHSITTKSDLLSMYRKEHPELVANLKIDGNLDLMWEHLEYLLSTKKVPFFKSDNAIGTTYYDGYKIERSADGTRTIINLNDEHFNE